MASTSHNVATSDGDLGELRALVAEMGGLAEAAIDGSVRALIGRDLETAARIVDEDRRIDALEAELERRVVRLLTLRAPDAGELRDVLAALKIASVVERIGDYAKNIAKRVPLLRDAREVPPMAILPAMAAAASEMVHDTLDAFVARDPERAIEICQRDRKVDDFYNSLFRALLPYMMENPGHVGTSTHLLFIGKNLERIGDHATNAAEMIYFAATGEQMVERARGADTLAPVEER